MNFTQLKQATDRIKSLIKKDRLTNALEELDSLVSWIDDDELIKHLVTITARHNRNNSKERISDGEKEDQRNRVVYSLTDLLLEAKHSAIDKISIQEGEKLEQLNSEASSMIVRIDEMTRLMIESRVLEMEMFVASFDFRFSAEQRSRMQEQLRRFRLFLDENNS